MIRIYLVIWKKTYYQLRTPGRAGMAYQNISRIVQQETGEVRTSTATLLLMKVASRGYYYCNYFLCAVDERDLKHTSSSLSSADI
jgi:hypothetical protein